MSLQPDFFLCRELDNSLVASWLFPSMPGHGKDLVALLLQWAAGFARGTPCAVDRGTSKPQGQPWTHDPNHVWDIQCACHVRFHPSGSLAIFLRANHWYRSGQWWWSFSHSSHLWSWLVNFTFSYVLFIFMPECDVFLTWSRIFLYRYNAIGKPLMFLATASLYLLSLYVAHTTPSTPTSWSSWTVPIDLHNFRTNSTTRKDIHCLMRFNDRTWLVVISLSIWCWSWWKVDMPSPQAQSEKLCVMWRTISDGFAGLFHVVSCLSSFLWHVVFWCWVPATHQSGGVICF